MTLREYLTQWKLETTGAMYARYPQERRLGFFNITGIINPDGDPVEFYVQRSHCRYEVNYYDAARNIYLVAFKTDKQIAEAGGAARDSTGISALLKLGAEEFCEKLGL